MSPIADIPFLHQEDMLADNPLVLKKEVLIQWNQDLAALFSLCRSISVEEYKKNHACLRSDHRQIAEAYLYHDRPLPVIVRPDAMLINGSLQIIEMNMDSSIGGQWELERIQEHLSAAHPHMVFPKPYEAVSRYFQDLYYSRFFEIDSPVIVVIAYRGFTEETLQKCRFFCRRIQETTPFRVFLKFPDELYVQQGYVADTERKYDLIYRDFALVRPIPEQKDIIELLVKAASSRTLVLSDPLDLYVEQKGIIATLSTYLFEKPEKFTKEERKLIASYIPWTRFVAEGDLSLQELLVRQKNDFVLKRTCSHHGDFTAIGTQTSDEKWRAVLNEVSQSSVPWVAQVNLRSTPFPFSYHDEVKEKSFVFSPYYYGEHFGAAFIRVEQDPSQRVLSLPSKSIMGLAGVAVYHA